MNVPLGATGTFAPLIVSDARPLPTEPKMKFESRTAIDWFGAGKTVLGASGPSVSGIVGSGGAARGVMPRSNVATVGGVTPERAGAGDGVDGAGFF